MSEYVTLSTATNILRTDIGDVKDWLYETLTESYDLDLDIYVDDGWLSAYFSDFGLSHDDVFYILQEFGRQTNIELDYNIDYYDTSTLKEFVNYIYTQTGGGYRK